MNITDIDRACRLAEIAGGGVGITLTAAELRFLLDINAVMLAALEDARLWIVEAILGMGGIPDHDVTILPAIRAAIAKAKPAPEPEPDICPDCGGDVGHRINCPRGIAFSRRDNG
jgi:hypothetical protein